MSAPAHPVPCSTAPPRTPQSGGRGGGGVNPFGSRGGFVSVV